MKRVSAKREELALARCLLLPPVSTSVDDSDLPVALRKGKRSCVTHHSIAQYVSYSGISPPYPTLRLLTLFAFPGKSLRHCSTLLGRLP